MKADPLVYSHDQDALKGEGNGSQGVQAEPHPPAARQEGIPPGAVAVQGCYKQPFEVVCHIICPYGW